MDTSPKLTDKQYRFLFSLITLSIWCFTTGISFFIAGTYHSYFALFLAINIFIVILLFRPLKKNKMSHDEKQTYPLFLIFGLAMILWASALLYLGKQPGIWILSFVVGSGLLNSMVIFQFLRNRKII